MPAASLFPRTLARVTARRGTEHPRVDAARVAVERARGRVRVARLTFLALAVLALATAWAGVTDAALVLAVTALAAAGVTGRFVRNARDARAGLRRARRATRNAAPPKPFEAEQRSIEP